jgi:hypothetical protein
VSVVEADVVVVDVCVENSSDDSVRNENWDPRVNWDVVVMDDVLMDDVLMDDVLVNTLSDVVSEYDVLWVVVGSTGLLVVVVEI